jgi:glycosyltransferase involved in cell wall biosynthesis
LALPAGKNSMTAEEVRLFNEALLQAFKSGGLQSLVSLLTRQTKGSSKKLAAVCQLQAANTLLGEGLVDSAIQLVDSALCEDASMSTLRSAAKIFHDAALLDRALEISNKFLKVASNPAASDQRFIAEIHAKKQLVDWAGQRPIARAIPVVKRKVLNVLAFSLPYTSVGYATRSHGLALGIKHAGWNVCPYTRPGFPYDFKPELVKGTLAEKDEIDGLTYHRVFDIERRGMGETEYIHAAIKHWERVIELEQPEIVHAASNYVTALPVMIAARRKGVPFVYEIRGFWEVTRSSRDSSFVNTPKYRYMRFFESLVARHADRVITITNAMKEELVTCGVPANNIAIAFNSVDAERFITKPRNQNLAMELGISNEDVVIGYIGTLVDYEGLDDLITACAGLVKDGLQFRLLLVGDGAQSETLRRQVANLGLADRVLFVGRVPHKEVEDYYSLLDIAPFPRKPWEVCEMVSPLKPFEAMALEKAVVVSNTRALSEIVIHGTNGLHFEKGNIADLQQTLSKLVRDNVLRQTLGKAARTWVLEHRTWDTAGKVCTDNYSLALHTCTTCQPSAVLAASN